MKLSQRINHVNLETVSEMLATNCTLTLLIIREVFLATASLKSSNHTHTLSKFHVGNGFISINQRLKHDDSTKLSGYVRKILHR
jgi:hypothetical protein